MANKAQAFQQACRLHSHHANGQLIHSSNLHPVRTKSTRAISYTANPSNHTSKAINLRHAFRREPSPRTVPPFPRTQPQRGASTSSGQNRRAITVTSDDGRYNWSELSTGEKAARGTQQTFNFLIVSAGAVLTVTVFYLLYTELFAPDSSTIQFNAAVSRIKASPECRALLGPSRQIKAYGEPTSNKWARARPLAYSNEVDRFGTTHFRMHFNVEGPAGMGVVNVHMTRPRDGDGLEYEVLSLNIKGQETVYLENKAAERGVKGKASKMFGIQWR